MIQIIFDYEDKAKMLEIAEGNDFKLNIIDVPEMNDAYLTLIAPEMVADFVAALKLPPLRFEMIGSYNMDGTQYIWDATTGQVSWNHSINKYKSKLKDVVAYDEEGTEISRRRPTTVEASNTQVNKIMGYADRNIA